MGLREGPILTQAHTQDDKKGLLPAEDISGKRSHSIFLLYPKDLPAKTPKPQGITTQVKTLPKPGARENTLLVSKNISKDLA